MNVLKVKRIEDKSKSFHGVGLNGHFLFQNFDFIIDLNLTAYDDRGEDAFAGNDAIADCVKNVASVMAGFADLQTFQEHFVVRFRIGDGISMPSVVRISATSPCCTSGPLDYNFLSAPLG